MLGIVGQVLEEMGLAAPRAALRYYINITTGDSLSIAAFVDDERFYQVKISEFLDLREQYALYCRARNDHASFVPRPLGYRVRNEWNMMLCEGVHHVAVRGADVLRPRWRDAGDLREQFCAYFAGASGGSPVPRPEQAELMDALAAHFRASVVARIADACMSQAVALGVGSMLARPQHGDFVINNIGRTGKQIVVFDWEDYAKINLPGLDVCTLFLSLLGGGVAAARAMMRPEGGGLGAAGVAFLDRACERQGVEPALFRRLVPFYLLVFLYLKRNYGPSVQERISALLRALSPT